MGATESPDNIFIFFRFRRARTIDQHPAGPQAWGHRFEDLTLERLMSRENLLILPPFRFRVSP
jgi:hypothetical protein